MTTPEPKSEMAAHLAADIRALTKIERPSASPGEETAAKWVASRFQEEGLNAEIETFRYNPDYWSVWGAHSLLSATAAWTALMSRRWALAAAATAALATASLFGEFTGNFHLLRRALPTRRSYNVLARLPNPSASRVLLVSAHHDAPRSGLMFHPIFTSSMARLLGPSRDQALPLGAIIASILAVSTGALGVSGGKDRLLARRLLRSGGIYGLAFTALMWDVARRPLSPGANDDASGVAVMIALASKLRREPVPDAEVWFLSTGSEEGMLGGMRAFLASHRAEISKRETMMLNLEMLGSGRLAYLTGDGFLQHKEYLSPAVELARQASADSPHLAVRELEKAPFYTDALAATQVGMPAVTLTSINENGYVPHYHWPTDTVDNLDMRSVQNAFLFTHQVAVRMAAVT